MLAGILAGIKTLQIRRMIAKGEKAEMPPETVTAAVVRSESWGEHLTAVGSLTAVQGVTVAAEVAGKIVHLGFESGGSVQAGTVLLKQDTDSEAAQLRGAEANLALAKLNFERNANLLRQNLVSRLDFDNAEAQYKQTESQGDSLRAIIGKKTIRAPFSGHLGIRLVNLGQMLREGDPIVSLQSLDPVYVNFLLPQQQLGQIKTGLAVRVTSDALAGQVIEGKITAINAEVDAATRNIQVQGTVANPKKLLFPGMFVMLRSFFPKGKMCWSFRPRPYFTRPTAIRCLLLKRKKMKKTAGPSKPSVSSLSNSGKSAGTLPRSSPGSRKAIRS